MRARHTDHPTVDHLFSKANIWHQDQYRQTKAILSYLADLNSCHLQHKTTTSAGGTGSAQHEASLDWGTIFRQREHYAVPPPVFNFSPHIHPAWITACVWGNQYADLVFRFCTSLVWPDPLGIHTDPLITQGITWHELTIAFVVNTGVQFPTWIHLPESQRAQPVHWQDPRVLALPIPKRALREQAEAFRTIVIYLQSYTSTPLLPTYSKTGSISLTQVGWGRSYTGGFALRPQMPNAGAVQRTLIQYAADLHCKPPYHPDGLIPMRFIVPSIPVVDAISLTFHQRFLYRRNLRKSWNRNGDLDTVSIPVDPN